MGKIICSGCLLGLACRYQGDARKNEAITALATEHVLIPVCPEQMGGLPTPRPPAEICEGRVMTAAGDDVTEQYRRGAEMALQVAQMSGAGIAVLKARSPSCGKGSVHDGTFTGGLVSGNGVTAELFLQNGIAVYTEEELDALERHLRGNL